MRKIIIVSVMFLLAGSVLASPIKGCMDSRATNYNSQATEPDTCVFPMGNGDPQAVGQPWGLSGHQTPKVATGSVVKDEMGVSYKCPSFFPSHMGCFNITKTDFYRNQMQELARKMVANGWSKKFIELNGWYNIVR